MTQVVGRSTPRVEGVAKVTGKAQYSADLQLPDTLRGRCLRSPVPYARIKKIDTSKAERVAGVKAVLTGLDVPGLRIGRCIYDTPVLADGIVRFIGEKVAAVAATSIQAAEEALELIEVEYEEIDAAARSQRGGQGRLAGAASRSAVLQGTSGAGGKGQQPVRLSQVGQGRYRSRLQAGRPDRRKHFYHSSDAPVLFGTPCLRRRYSRRRQRRYLVVQQDAVCRARPAVELHRHRQGKIGFSSHAYRRRLRRQGRLHGRGAGLLPVEEEPACR